MATLGLGLSASANERGTCFITFDAPGAGTGPFEGTLPQAINPAGAIAGLYLDASSLYHGFLRDPDGALTTIDVPGAHQTFPYSINPAGAIAGYYGVAGVIHGFLRAPNGTLTTFDAPGAGTGFAQGTLTRNLNPAGAIAGYYNDNSNVGHGYVRAPDGTITTIDAPGAGTGTGQGTLTTTIDGLNPGGVIAGASLDNSNVYHGFVRAARHHHRLRRSWRGHRPLPRDRCRRHQSSRSD